MASDELAGHGLAQFGGFVATAVEDKRAAVGEAAAWFEIEWGSRIAADHHPLIDCILTDCQRVEEQCPRV